MGSDRDGGVGVLGREPEGDAEEEGSVEDDDDGLAGEAMGAQERSPGTGALVGKR